MSILRNLHLLDGSTTSRESTTGVRTTSRTATARTASTVTTSGRHASTTRLSTTSSTPSTLPSSDSVMVSSTYYVTGTSESVWSSAMQTSHSTQHFSGTIATHSAGCIRRFYRATHSMQVWYRALQLSLSQSWLWRRTCIWSEMLLELAFRWKIESEKISIYLKKLGSRTLVHIFGSTTVRSNLQMRSASSSCLSVSRSTPLSPVDVKYTGLHINNCIAPNLQPKVPWKLCNFICMSSLVDYRTVRSSHHWYHLILFSAVIFIRLYFIFFPRLGDCLWVLLLVVCVCNLVCLLTKLRENGDSCGHATFRMDGNSSPIIYLNSPGGSTLQ